jgi:hypothetical protein
MSKKYIIELEAKVDRATGEVEQLRKEIQSLNQQVVQTNKDTTEGIKNVEKATKGTTGAIRRLGASIKQLGLGILIASWQKIQELFGSNQMVLNAFNIAFEALSIIFNDFVNFVTSNFGTVVNFFKAIFKDPLQSVKDLGTAIKNNIIERFESAIEVAGFLGTALKKLFQGDFAGALDAAQEAGKELIDVVTGVDDSFDKTVELVSNVADAVTKYGKSVLDTARNNVELARTAEINRVLNQGLIEQYDRQAEKLRQIRDDDRNTIAERIAANEALAKVLDEQEKRMLANAQAAIASAQAQFSINKNDENAIALLEAKNELLAVEAQIEGFRSEQLANSNSLQREQLELTQSIIDANTERAIDQAKFDAEFIQGEVARLEAMKAVFVEESRLEEQRLKDKRDSYKEGTQAFVDANNELLAFQQKNAQQQKQIDRDILDAKLSTVSTSLGQIANLLGENSKFGKGLAVTQAIIDTYVGANKAISQGGIFGAVAAAGVIATGIANVKKIVATKDPTAPSFASGSVGGSTAAPAISAAPPAFNVVGASSESQLAQAIGGQSRNPVKAYVVAGEVTTAQALERNTIQEASI